MYQPFCSCCYQSEMLIHHSDNGSTENEMVSNGKKKLPRRSKHIPHHLRPQHIVERRNTRERRRVQDVNQAFYTLQSLLPSENNPETSSRLSKVRTLRKAVDYIVALQQMLDNYSFPYD